MKDFKINPIEQNGQRVLTTTQLAEAYGTDVKVISHNFNRNKSHYIEGKHFYCLTGKELKKFKSIRQFGEQFKQASKVYLWTERGALLHAKSLNTDKAWEVYEFLVDTYFRVQGISNSYAELVKLLRNDLSSDMERVVNTAVEKAVSETVKVLAPYMKSSEENMQTKDKVPCRKRNYHNGKIFNLPQDIRRKVDDMIISGEYSCQKIADFIEENTGIEISYMTVSRYIKKYFMLQK